MAIDINSETLIPLSEAPAEIPGRPSLCTLWRWRLKGVKGRKLESLALGGKIFTSREAIKRFVQHQGGTEASKISTPAKRERSIAQAERELADI